MPVTNCPPVRRFSTSVASVNSVTSLVTSVTLKPSRSSESACCVCLFKKFFVCFLEFLIFLFESFQESFLKRYNAGLPQWSAIISDNPIDNLLEFVKLQWSALDCEYRGTECVTFTVTKELKECLNKDPSRTPRIVFARWTVPSVLMRSVETSWSLVDCSNKWPSAIAELF